MSFEASLAETHQRKLKFATEKGIEQGLQQGLQQGIQQGLQQGVIKGQELAKLQIARKMIDAGMLIDQVAAMLEILVDDILREHTSS